MPFFFQIDALAVMPLRAIAFQSLLLLVAIALEAIVLRRQLRLGFQPSIRYAATLNLLAVVLGWVTFLTIEPLLPVTVRTQVISYVLFGHFYANQLSGSVEAIMVATGLVTFFLTFWIKAKALEFHTYLLGSPIVESSKAADNTNRFRYRRPDSGMAPPHLLAVLQANALSFTAVLLLLLLRNGVV